MHDTEDTFQGFLVSSLCAIQAELSSYSKKFSKEIQPIVIVDFSYQKIKKCVSADDQIQLPVHQSNTSD